MTFGVNNMRVLVTAGASGIGLETARAFVEEGALVHVCDIDERALDALGASDPALSASRTDVSDRGAVEGLFGEVVAHWGGLDILVNNAGIAGPTGRVEEIDPEDWDRCLAVCLTSQFNCVRLAVPLLKESQNASIVNLSSVAGRFGYPLRTPYAAAKWGVIGFTKSLSRELGEFGVRVNAVLPGLVTGDRRTRMLEDKAAKTGRSFEDIARDFVVNASVKEPVSPRQIADQILFLASPRSRTLSGQAISVDGDLQMIV